MKLGNRELALLFATMFVVMVGFGIVIPTLPFYARELGATSFQMGLLVTVWAGAQLVSAPFWGNLSDRVGRKPILMLGLLGFSLAFFLLTLARSMTTLILVRVIGGILSASTVPTAQAFIADVTTPENRGPAMALIGASFGVGFVFGPAVGGLLAPFGVTVPFYAAAAAGLVTLPIAYLVLPESHPRLRRPAGAGQRPPGAARLEPSPAPPAPGHGAPAVPVTSPRPAPAGQAGPGLTCPPGGLASIVFAVRTPYAIFFWLAFAATFSGSSMFSMLSYFLMDRFQGTATDAGTAFVVQGLTFVTVQGLLVGRLIRRLGEDATAQIGLTVGALGFLGIAAAPNFGWLLAMVAVAGVGMALMRPSITSLVSKRTTLPQGITMGVQASFDSLGRVVGPMWAGFTFGLAIVAPYLSAAAVFLLALVAYRTLVPQTLPVPPVTELRSVDQASD